MKTIEWIMMAAFIGGLLLALWKLYAFIPNKPLTDDDTTPQSIALQEKIMIESNQVAMSEEELYKQMLTHPEFDPKHFWRFNENRLKQLIAHYRLKEPNFRL